MLDGAAVRRSLPWALALVACGPAIDLADGSGPATSSTTNAGASSVDSDDDEQCPRLDPDAKVDLQVEWNEELPPPGNGASSEHHAHCTVEPSSTLDQEGIAIELSCTYAEGDTARAHRVEVQLPPGFGLDLEEGQTIQIDGEDVSSFEVGSSSFFQLMRDGQVVLAYWRTGLFSGRDGCWAEPPHPDFAAIEISPTVGKCDHRAVDFTAAGLASQAPVGVITALSSSLIGVVEDPVPEPPDYCRFEAMVFAPS